MTSTISRRRTAVLAAIGIGLGMGGFAAMPLSAAPNDTAARETPEESATTAKSASDLVLFVGTYTQKTSKGIYALRMDPETGKLSSIGLVAETQNPSFLVAHPNGKYLYATNEIGNFQGTSSGAISAFEIPGEGTLKLLNQQPSKGSAPCDICLDPSGKFVLAANYSGGSTVVLPILPDGKLGPASGFFQHKGSSINKQRQEGPHAHSVGLDKKGRFVYVADLGIDRVLVFQFEQRSGALIPNPAPAGQTEPGAGPRHFKLHPNGNFGYVINELNSTITAFKHDGETGALDAMQAVSTLPADFKGTNHPAELVIHPNGKFLYGSNRGHDSLVICAIDEESGELTVVGHQPTLGKNPRNFVIDPSGRFLVVGNQDTDDIYVFKIDQATGKLTATGEKAEVSMPVCLVFHPGKQE